MKKLNIIIMLLVLLIIPFYVNAATCESKGISISNIEVENKSSNVEELSNAFYNDNNINLNLSMSEVGDRIIYKIIFKNNLNDDFEFNRENLKIKSDYIDYTIESMDDSYIIKSKSSKTMYLKVEYKNEIPSDSFTSGFYNDNKNITINLLDNQIKTNPNTGNHFYLLFSIILTISVIIFILFKKKHFNKYMILLINIMIIIPIGTYALCSISFSLNINTKISFGNRIESCENCVYAYTTSIWKYGEDGTILTNNQYKNDYREVISESNKEYFLGLVLDENKRIKKAYACGILHDTPFCLEGSKSDEYGGNLENRLKTYNINKQILLSTYVNDDECEINSNGKDVDCFSFDRVIDAYAYDDGGVGTYSSLSKGSCDISFYDYLGCYVY